MSGGKAADSAKWPERRNWICRALGLAEKVVGGEASWLRSQNRGRAKEGVKWADLPVPVLTLKWTSLGEIGGPGRYGVSPLEWVAAHESSGEGKSFPFP